MAASTYNQTLDTMVSTALDTYTKDPVNALTDSGEKFLKGAASMGRLFVVNDAETVRHPIMYDHGENSTYYEPDLISGDSGAVNRLSETATEILTQAVFHLQAASRNINFPQSQPPGNLIDYVSSVVKANMMHILSEEEVLFTQGRVNAGTGAATRRDPFTGDASYSAGFPMSLPSILMSSSNPSSDTSSPTGDNTADTFAAVSVDSIPKWQPYHVASTGTDYSGLLGDLQKAILNSSYSETERATHVYMTLNGFEQLLALLRADAALPDPVNANLGKEGTVAFGGVTVDWSRYLQADEMYDLTPAVGGTDTAPIIGVNWNSLRLNTVRAGGVGSDSVGFIRQIGDMQAHPLKTNLFKRIEWKRQWSVDNGRRSFFTIYGNLD